MDGPDLSLLFFFFKQKTAYEIVPCDWSSDVCSSDLPRTRSSGSVIPGRDPKLAARKNRDEDREEPRKKAEREHRRTAAPSGEDVKGARKHGEAPHDKRPIHGVRVEFDRSQAHRRLDRGSSDF